MRQLHKILRFILCVPKTLIFNFRYFPLATAIKFPVIVSHKVKFRRLGGSIELKKVKFAMVRIGFGDMECYDFSKTPTLFSNKGKIIFTGKIKIGSGSVISNQGILEFGEYCNLTKVAFICRKSIKIGDHNLYGWDCLLMDTDHHHIYPANAEITADHASKINADRAVEIKDKVWLGAKCSILKGVTIGEGNVIAGGTMVTKSITAENSIISNVQELKILKENIRWHE